MASNACCAAGDPVQLEYEAKGETKKTADGLTVYVTGTGNRAVIFIHDIFGLKFTQVFQIADRLASSGFVVAVPELFDEKPWPMSEFPPPDGAKFMSWINSMPIESVANKINQVRKWLQETNGNDTFGACGFCWGSSVSLHLASDPAFAACACCHPAFFGKEMDLAQAANAPVCILATAEDPMEQPKSVLDQKPFASKCFYQRFDDQVHGFMAARGDYSKEHVAAAAGRGVGMLGDFFGSCLAA